MTVSYSDELCGKVLHHYVGTFNFTGLGFDDALRKFLSAFRLPGRSTLLKLHADQGLAGEAQKIERIMDAFAAQFHRNNPRAFRHPDTAFKLAYSVIMLNTDAHNPAIKQSRKMTKEQFVRNNRGLDDGHDLPQEFLEIIHDRYVVSRDFECHLVQIVVLIIYLGLSPLRLIMMVFTLLYPHHGFDSFC